MNVAILFDGEKARQVAQLMTLDAAVRNIQIKMEDIQTVFSTEDEIENLISRLLSYDLAVILVQEKMLHTNSLGNLCMKTCSQIFGSRIQVVILENIDKDMVLLPGFHQFMDWSSLSDCSKTVEIQTEYEKLKRSLGFSTKNLSEFKDELEKLTTASQILSFEKSLNQSTVPVSGDKEAQSRLMYGIPLSWKGNPKLLTSEMISALETALYQNSRSGVLVYSSDSDRLQTVMTELFWNQNNSRIFMNCENYSSQAEFACHLLWLLIQNERDCLDLVDLVQLRRELKTVGTDTDGFLIRQLDYFYSKMIDGGRTILVFLHRIDLLNKDPDLIASPIDIYLTRMPSIVTRGLKFVISKPKPAMEKASGENKGRSRTGRTLLDGHFRNSCLDLDSAVSDRNEEANKRNKLQKK